MLCGVCVRWVTLLCVIVGSALGGMVEVGGTAGHLFLQLLLSLVPLSDHTLRTWAQKAQGWACQQRKTKVNI